MGTATKLDALLHPARTAALSITRTSEGLVGLDLQRVPGGRWERIDLSPEEATRVGMLLLKSGIWLLGERVGETSERG
ncbi:hypothetical protein [Anaeromyxobacter diazotrophicus]|uniref:Uncharacterized protein n=1 Tax=Anaeromyxobacter diazotrophicus TaxID=2590199 RepID=A0A7I9VKJ3_9BACT|nr:hypothetical protein [Anaeromyxobacter diazotrophicus]GEJ56936.1 hypothetical protein AMYX_16770 [Anaeromyxobacter diazotrophicus]